MRTFQLTKGSIMNTRELKVLIKTEVERQIRPLQKYIDKLIAAKAKAKGTTVKRMGRPKKVVNVE